MDSLQRWLLVVPLLVLTSTTYIACSSDEEDVIYSPDSGIDHNMKKTSSPDGSISDWPDAASDVDLDVEDADAPFSGTG